MVFKILNRASNKTENNKGESDILKLSENAEKALEKGSLEEFFG